MRADVTNGREHLRRELEVSAVEARSEAEEMRYLIEAVLNLCEAIGLHLSYSEYPVYI